MPGVTDPTGFFDPFGLSEGLSQERVRYFREAEIKHGRVAMLAALGFLVAENFHPLFGGAIDVPSFVAFQATPLQTFWPAVLVAIGALESISVGKFKDPQDNLWQLKDDVELGDFGFDPLGLKPKDAEEMKSMQNKELNNGRLAMLSIAGMVAQELVTSQKLFGGAPVSAASAAEMLESVNPEHVTALAAEMASVLNLTI